MKVHDNFAAVQWLVSMVQAERAAIEKQEEEKYRQQALQKLAEEDRIEQMNAQRRRLKMAEHKREVERLLAEKRAIFEAALARPLASVALSFLARLTQLAQSKRWRFLCFGGCRLSDVTFVILMCSRDQGWTMHGHPWSCPPDRSMRCEQQCPHSEQLQKAAWRICNCLESVTFDERHVT